MPPLLTTTGTADNPNDELVRINLYLDNNGDPTESSQFIRLRAVSECRLTFILPEGWAFSSRGKQVLKENALMNLVTSYPATPKELFFQCINVMKDGKPN